MARRILLGLLLCLAWLAVPAIADEDDALDLVEEAEEALEELEFKAAEALYRRALKKSDTCLPAHYGLGEALLEQKKTDEAVVAFRKVLRVARSSDALPVSWDRYVRRARKQLERHDERGAELEEVVDEHVSALMALAAKFKATDPDLADRAIDAVLLLRPEHERALQIRGKMSAAGARRVPIFDGKQIDDWDGGRSKWWSVEGGAILAKAKGVATYIRNQDTIEGNFDVVMEARITEAGGEVPFIALMAGWNAEYDHSRFGALGESLMWYEHQGEDKKERVFREALRSLKKPLDPARWTTYELRFREDRIHAVVNGVEVHAIERSKARAGGYVGILAQDCQAEIRRLDVLQR